VESATVVGSESPVLVGSHLVEQAAAEVVFQVLRRLGRLTQPGKHSSQCRACRPLSPSAFQAREGDLKPRSVLPLHSGTPPIARFTILPLRVQVAGHIAVSCGGQRVILVPQAAVDLQRPALTVRA
jgi:hypothetical protein